MEFLQNDRLDISSFCGIYFGIVTVLRTLDPDTNICTGTLHSELEAVIGTTTVSDLSFATTLAAALDHFMKRLSGHRRNFQQVLGHNQRDWHLLINCQDKRVKKKNEKTVQ